MQIIRILRQPRLSEQEISDVLDALQAHCNHVAVGEVPPGTTWFLSTNAAVQVACSDLGFHWGSACGLSSKLSSTF